MPIFYNLSINNGVARWGRADYPRRQLRRDGKLMVREKTCQYNVVVDFYFHTFICFLNVWVDVPH